MVVYRDLATRRAFVRPLAVFTGLRDDNGVLVPRFVLEAPRGGG